MPIWYDISPELNTVLYVCTGAVTPLEFFSVGDTVALDPRFHARMNVIIDFFAATLDLAVSDLHLAVSKHRETEQRGQSLGKTAVLTRSGTLKFFADALQAFSLDSITNFRILHTEQDAAQWLSLAEDDLLAMWAETREAGLRQAAL